MRTTELKARIAAYFSDPDTYMRDTVHVELQGRTVFEAMRDGDEPGDIWKAVVAHNPEMPPKFR